MSDDKDKPAQHEGVVNIVNPPAAQPQQTIQVIPQSMGLTGIIATIANTTEVVIVTALLVWFLTVMAPMEHERAALQRQMDRDAHGNEVKLLLQKADEREERQKIREDERMRKLWEKWSEANKTLTEVVIEIRTLKKN